MLSVASAVTALAGIGLLALMPVPRQRKDRLLQQAVGAVLFTAGLASFVAVVFVKGQIVG